MDKKPLSPEDIDTIKTSAERHTKELGLMKLKIFHPNGEVLFSTDEEDIGRVNEKEYFYNIVAKGNHYSMVVRKDSPSADGHAVSMDVVETYVPVMTEGKFIGAFEIYYNITESSKALHGIQRISTVIPVAMTIGGLILTVIILMKLDRLMFNQKMTEQELTISSQKLEHTNREVEDNRAKLQKAIDQISSLIQNVTSRLQYEITLSNPHLKKCYEIKNCKKQDCPCYGKDAVRCWQVAGTYCGGKVQGEFANKYGNCSECNVYKMATEDPIYQIGEQFNNMLHVLNIKSRELEGAYVELKATQSQMLQREKMASVGQLAAGVAHEINNPMGFIMSNLGTLANYTDKLTEFIDAQAEALQTLHSRDINEKINGLRNRLKLDFVINDLGQLIGESLEGAERVKKIVQNLKSFSRLDEADCKPADINECIESTLNIVWNELKYKATVEKDYGSIPMIKCYPQQLNQVFMNLLVNASHAIEKQGVIHIKTWNGDESVKISISDTGCGIPEDKIGRIFEPFFTTKEVGKGTGLGLSISYDIVKKHNGEITVDSKVGKGTFFTVSIPVVQA